MINFNIELKERRVREKNVIHISNLCDIDIENDLIRDDHTSVFSLIYNKLCIFYITAGHFAKHPLVFQISQCVFPSVHTFFPFST